MSAFCAAHAAEDDVIPDGERRGWPTDVDFDALPVRIKALRSKLTAIVKSPRERSQVFFHGALKEWKENGARVMGGVMAQMSGMARSQPG